MTVVGLAPWRLEFKPGWDVRFARFDRAVQRRILRTFDQMEQARVARGLHGSRFHLEEAGQYRIAFIEDEQTRTKRIHFVGDHKQYERWYRRL
jgi:hypothetical protein